MEKPILVDRDGDLSKFDVFADTAPEAAEILGLPAGSICDWNGNRIAQVDYIPRQAEVFRAEVRTLSE